jgi:hypothetical protein
VNEFLQAIPFGGLLGAIFGPVRLAGVDYSKWYRDPGEIRERDDRSWIGLMKWTAIYTGHRFLVILLVVAVIGPALPYLTYSLPEWLYAADSRAPFYLLHFFTWWSWAGSAGLIVGIAVAQVVVESMWRFGLRGGADRPLRIRLARQPRRPARPTVRAPVPGRRRLIICCDGTWNSPVQPRETNVVHLLRGIKPVGIVDPRPTSLDATPISQIVHYHLGVGTGNFVDRFLGGGAGIGLSSSVKACYGFLVDNYQLGDEILLFGFSRGAYVVRSVAGMIGVVGLLRKEEMFRFVEAWDYYALPEPKRNSKVLDCIAPQRHRDVEIRCLGVWDTVGALGIPGTRLCSSAYAFHETGLGGHVRYAFQALALDERRGNFQPAVWVKRIHDPDQLLEQVWFPGVHSDIGGGYHEHGLSDATLLWMLSRLQDNGLIDFEPQSIDDPIARFYAEPYATGVLHNSRTMKWKIIACPVPRPVGITDESEKVHISAFNRGDFYATGRRRDWLNTLPRTKVLQASQFEQNHAFRGASPGTAVRPIVTPRRGVCDWVVRRLFGAT